MLVRDDAINFLKTQCGCCLSSTPSFGAPTPGLFLAKYSAEKTKYIDVSQPPHQGDELKRC